MKILSNTRQGSFYSRVIALHGTNRSYDCQFVMMITSSLGHFVPLGHFVCMHADGSGFAVRDSYIEFGFAKIEIASAWRRKSSRRKIRRLSWRTYVIRFAVINCKHAS